MLPANTPYWGQKREALRGGRTHNLEMYWVIALFRTWGLRVSRSTDWASKACAVFNGFGTRILYNIFMILSNDAWMCSTAKQCAAMNFFRCLWAQRKPGPWPHTLRQSSQPRNQRYEHQYYISSQGYHHVLTSPYARRIIGLWWFVITPTGKTSRHQSCTEEQVDFNNFWSLRPNIIASTPTTIKPNFENADARYESCIKWHIPHGSAL